MKKGQKNVKKSRTEERDGKTYTVTVLDEVKPPKYRSKRTKFKYKDVNKRGNKHRF
jgi:hypothetical protein